MTQNPNLAALSAEGVSVWLDDLSRERLQTGNLQNLIDTRSVVGVTTNPSIFQAALSKGNAYDEQVKELAARGADVDATIRTVTTDDVRNACDVLAKVYEASGGADGRVSIEVDPRLAHDTDKTILQAIELWKIVDRPNVLIKIPATQAGLPAITAVIAEGISVNVTLIFSVERHREVMDAYLAGLEKAKEAGHDLSKIHSVASFFVSRVDTEIDKRLEDIGTEEALQLRGQAGVANARLAYAAYQQVFVGGERYAALFADGAHAQRPLWASTGVKNPDYSDTLYVTELVAKNTVNTMPEKTLEAVADHGVVTGDTISGTAGAAQMVFDRLAAIGIDLTDVFLVLENEGVDKFEKSWAELLEATQGQFGRSFAMSSAPAADWQNPLRDKLDKRLPRIAGPCAVIIFGVTGDLATKKLMPAIYDLANRGLLPPTFSLIGFARRDWRDEDFGDIVLKAVQAHARTPFRQEVWDRLNEGIRFVQGTFDDDDAFVRLSDTLAKLDAERGTGGNHAFYLSIPPKAFPTVCEQLSKSGLARPDGDRWSRVVIEKPFGHDLDSAKSLNQVVNSVFPESSVFRIDHYLGKETVQNILALRFANQLFDPIWNAHYVDHVQITMAEDIGLGGRGGYYDGVGAARDVIQNHLMQLLALTAMEEPVSFSPAELQSEKIKVLSATQLAEPLDENTSRGQYTAGWQGGEKVVGLLEEEGFSKTSTTETFAAITLEVDTRRWAGVPFYLRTGKRLGRRVTEIALVFKRAPHLPFDATMTDELGKNALVIRVQPDEGITLRFGSKVPGHAMEVRDVNMDFSYGSAFAEDSPEAYERLILDVLLGEPSLFPVNQEVELSWKILDPALEYWASHGKPDPYEAGGWGPDSAFEMLQRTGREWRRP